MNDSVPRHPEVRTMVAFIEGRLPADELRSVSEHLRGCRECRAVVTETSLFEEEERRAAAPKRTRVWWLAAAAMIAAIAIGIPFLIRPESTPIARLIKVAPREHRLVEARLSGFPWARLQAPSRGEAIPDPADLQLAGAAGDVLKETAGKQEPEARRSAGVAYLLIGRPHESITALEQAANQSNDARAWNDLAAARYAVATREERPSQLPEALAAVDHALRIDPKSAEARFNRALILERMGIREQARNAWQEYLGLDPASAWSNEARAHLQALSGQSRKFDPAMLAHPDAALVREFPQEARKSGEGPLLCEFAAADNLSRARLLADALAAFNGEHLLDDAVAAIERANADQHAALAEAHRLYCAARKAYDKRHAGDAEKQLRRAAELFDRGGSPMAHAARYYAANAVFDQNRGPAAREELLLLRSRFDASRYRALSAQIGWTLALEANSAGDVNTGAREAAAAAAIFRALGEKTNEAFVDGIAAHALELTGRSDAAWTLRIHALLTYCGGSDRVQCNGILNDTADELIALDRPAAALALSSATIASAGDPFAQAMELVKRARVALRAGSDAIAADVLVRARAASGRIADAALRETTDAQIDIEEATLGRAANPRRSIDVLGRSLAFLASHDIGHLLPYAYLQRARTFRTAGDEASALNDYRAALHEISSLRPAVLDTARQVIDDTIDLQLSRGDAAAAFQVAESRYEQAVTTSPKLPAGTAAIEYAVLPKSIAIFCVTGDSVVARRVPIDRRELESRVEALTSSIRRRAPIGEVHAASSAMYALLIAPIRSQLDGIAELVIVPDGRLFSVPFAALFDARSKRWLFDDFEIRFAPAVALLKPARSTALSPALIIGDPPSSRPRLARGRAEAEQIAAVHHGTLLTAEAATRARFIEAARGSALIYFAGHAESDDRDSALLLAGGAISESDIARMHLERQPLVVLAACGTFRGDPMHVGGMSSLARAFLTAGARAVVGTLWEVDDDVTASLFLQFHENLRADASPARALREAQRSMIRSSDPRLAHPATWSPVEVLSGTV